MMKPYSERVGFRAKVTDEMTGKELGIIGRGCDEASGWVTGTLEDVALRVYRSFDLRSARNASSTCACPYHGTEECDCQMVVLLVYDKQGAPATLVLHGHRGQTWMVLADTPDAELAMTIEDALVAALPARVWPASSG